MATGRIPGTSGSPLTAKGDIFAYSTTASRLPVGADGTTLVANSAATTGLAWTGNQAAGKNGVINGNLDYWQRGTSFSGTANAYTADRMYCQYGTATISRQTTGAPNGSQYVIRAAGTSASSYTTIAQILETSTTSTFWGQTVTFSFKARRNSSFATSLTVNIDKTSTVDGAFVGPTWTNISTTTVSNANLPTGTGSSNWYTTTLTAAIPNDGTANTIRVVIYGTAAFASGDYYELSQLQLELGSSPTTFTRAGGTLQGELAACQRYYVRFLPDDTGLYGNIGTGMGYNATQTRIFVTCPVQLRTGSKTLDYANCSIYDGTNASISVTSFTIATAGTKLVFVNANTAAGGVQYRPYLLEIDNNANGYFGISAEL